MTYTIHGPFLQIDVCTYVVGYMWFLDAVNMKVIYIRPLFLMTNITCVIYSSRFCTGQR